MLTDKTNREQISQSHRTINQPVDLVLLEERSVQRDDSGRPAGETPVSLMSISSSL